MAGRKDETVRPIHAIEFHQALIEAGVIDRFTRRVIIDAAADKATVIYVEKYGTTRLLEVVPHVLKGAEIRVSEDEALNRGEGE